MPRYDDAEWNPIHVNFNMGENTPRILVVHIMQGNLDGADSWFRNPAAQVSAHFGVRTSGRVRQWVDTNDRAWHAAEANSYSIGVEHSGHSGQPLTDEQIEATGRLLLWAHRRHGIPLWINTRPYTGSGLSWHGLGGTRWGGHPQCPGHPIVHQLDDILRVAKG